MAMTLENDPPVRLDLDPSSRSYRLREMYWAGTHKQAVVRKLLAEETEDTLMARARNFVTFLEANAPVIQPHELIVGALTVASEKGRIRAGDYDPHYPPGHARLLRRGLPSIRDEATERARRQTDPAKREFLEAVALSYDAAVRFIDRYARLAADMAASEQEATRKAELERIAAVCEELTKGPPASFHAALQLVQFVRVFGADGSVGRMDQWLYPFYRRDVEAGRITREHAQELLECLFIQMNFFGDVGPVSPRIYVPNDSLRNVALAGQTPAGKDACNELTYMCLEASGKLMLPEPKINVRFFPGSPARLARECCRVLGKGANVLAIFNDEVVIPSLLRLGIPLEEARDYCNDGCSELILGGKCTIKFKVHDALPLLNAAVLEAEGHPPATFHALLEDFKARALALVPADHGEPRPITHAFFAATIDDCLENATTEARYSINGSILAQVGNAADGLAAIKKLVYEDKSVAWSDLVNALKADYQGYETLRQTIRNRVPKYGNDEDYVDSLVKEIAESFCDGVLAKAKNPQGPGPKRAPGFMSFGIHLKSGAPATPDGRRAGDPTANSFSPAVGMDTRGPTAALSSVAKVDLTKASHGSVFDIALHASLVRGKGPFERFVALVDTFLKERSAATLQINVIDRDTLLRAKANPQAPEFRSLIVRVWGFSAVFVELPVGLQDHVIARTEHAAF